MATLGEMLLQAGAVTRAQIEEAIEAQVLSGGRLGTNLVEKGAITEETLAKLLAEQYGVHSAFGELLVQPELARLIPAEVADQHEVVPWKLDGKTLHVLCVDPENLAGLDEVARRTGKRVVPVVCPEFRLWRLLRSVYGLFRDVRAIDFAVNAPAKHALAEELTSEEEFQSLYSNILSGSRAGHPMALVAPATPRPGPAFSVPPPPPAPPPMQPQVFAAPAGPSTAPWPRPPPPPGAFPLPPGAFPPPFAAPPPPGPTVFSTPVGTPPIPAAATTSPLSFAGLQHLLAQRPGRDAIAHALTRCAAAKYRRAVLLVVQADALVGWDALGDGVNRDAARKVALPLDRPSVFRLVRETRQVHAGPMRGNPVTVGFLNAMGGAVPNWVLVAPVITAGRVVNVLYCDNGHGGEPGADPAELLLACTLVGRAYEELIAEQKRRTLGG